MSTPLIHSFQSLDDADAARAALLDAGVPADAIELRVINDEAGPVEGNFLVGNGLDQRESQRQDTDDPNPYKANFQNAVTRGVFLLIVGPIDGADRDRAASVLRSGP